MDSTIKGTFHFIRKEIQNILAVSYVLIVAIGMLFTHKKYSEFGINIFDYADVFDFLIAPFSDMRILLFSGITLFIVFLVVRSDIFLRAKYPRTYSKFNFGLEKKRFYVWVQSGTFTFLLILYLTNSASIYGNIAKKEVLKSASVELQYIDGEQIQGKIIGKTQQVLFLLEGETVKAVPILSTVKSYQIK
ncbi:MAG TPA: hypothetical protein VFF21_09480 [Flavobacteriaceae bacterium]|nr:hypothetical protein [Flavobacteriaceae bacterium]